MSKKKTEYYHLNFFEEATEKLKTQREDFIITSTTYTKTIRTKERNMFFNDKGKPDFKLLPLINKVREDGQIYIDSDGIIEETKIDFCNLYNLPKEEEIYVKIDMKSAYWLISLKENITSLATDKELKRITSGMPIDEIKKIRTKALGSLATTKTTRHYKDGKKFLEKIDTQPTKNVYMQVCRLVDRLMKECVEENPDCIYYYWDCIFAPKSLKKEVIDFFKKRGYGVTVKEAKFETVIVGDIAVLISTWDEKMYMSRRENKHVLEKYLQE